MKLMAGLIVVLLLIFSYRLFWSQPIPMAESKSQQKATEIKHTTNNTAVLPQLDNPNDEHRRQLMRSEYELLEQQRKKLKRHIGLLKHKMWGLKFSAENSKRISYTVMGANKLLKNPYMLGAFSSVEQIKDEIAKITFAETALLEIDMLVENKLREVQQN